MTDKTYIFGEIEYVLTGREAVVDKKVGRRDRVTVKAKKVEIRPVFVTDPEQKEHNRWVSPDEIYEVGGNE
jgi:hypothetical protein